MGGVGLTDGILKRSVTLITIPRSQSSLSQSLFLRFVGDVTNIAKVIFSMMASP